MSEPDQIPAAPTILARVRLAPTMGEALRILGELAGYKELDHALVIALRSRDSQAEIVGLNASPKKVAEMLRIAAASMDQVMAARSRDPARNPNVDSYASQTPHLPPASSPAVFSLAAEWAGYDAAALGARASPAERKASRRAFYCGAAGIYAAMIGPVGPGDTPGPADLARLDALHQELERFGEELLAGRG